MSASGTALAYSRDAELAECPVGAFAIPVLQAVRLHFSLIVPTYQEAENIERFARDVCAVLDRKLPSQYEVIVVDDDSPDGTWRLAASLMGQYPQIRVIRRTGERGLASAVVRGYQAASGKILGTINADFQHPPEVLSEMIDRARDVEIVVASRFCAGGGTGDWAKKRLMMSRAAHWAGKLMLPGVFGGLVADPLSGCYLFQRQVIEGIELAPMGFKTLIEITARGRASRIAECPYEMGERRKGMSKATFSSSILYLKQLRRLKKNDA